MRWLVDGSTPNACDCYQLSIPGRKAKIAQQHESTSVDGPSGPSAEPRSQRLQRHSGRAALYGVRRGRFLWIK
jgi:hypothetical protein